jgi:hypothetical protein
MSRKSSKIPFARFARRGSPEHELILNEFLSDVLTTLAEPDDEADSFGAGAAG